MAWFYDMCFIYGRVWFVSIVRGLCNWVINLIKILMEKINVLYLSNTGKGGATFSLLNLITSVKEYITPIVVFPNTEGVYSMFVNKGIECIVVPFQEEIFYSGQFRLFGLVQKVRFLLGRFRNILTWNLLFDRRVRKKLGARKVDIVHTNNGAIDLGCSLARSLGAKHVWHLREFQDLDFEAHPFFGWKRFYSRLYASDAVIGITKAIADHFNIMSNCKNGMYIWNAVASKKDVLYIKDKENYICFIASVISPGKGLHDLLKAYSLSMLPGKGFVLKIIGRVEDDNYKRILDGLICESGIKDNIEWIGYCKSIKDVISRSKALVMPSVNEALGRVAVEAMFYGCPAIARRSGGPTEYIVDKMNGYLFDDIEDLTEILNNVCFESQDKLIIRSQEFAVDNFSEEVYALKIMNVYKKLVLA